MANQPVEDEDNQSVINTLNDPRVTAFLRASVVVGQSLLIAMVLSLAGSMASWNATLQELKWKLNEIAPRVAKNEQDTNKLADRINAIELNVKFNEQRTKEIAWSLKELQRQR